MRMMAGPLAHQLHDGGSGADFEPWAAQIDVERGGKGGVGGVEFCQYGSELGSRLADTFGRGRAALEPNAAVLGVAR